MLVKEKLSQAIAKGFKGQQTEQKKDKTIV